MIITVPIKHRTDPITGGDITEPDYNGGYEVIEYHFDLDTVTIRTLEA